MEGVLTGAVTPDGVEVSGFSETGENTPDIVGFWRIERRLSQSLPADRFGVCAVIAPGTVQMANALIWQRDSQGIDSAVSRLTFRVETRVPKKLVPRQEFAVSAESEIVRQSKVASPKAAPVPVVAEAGKAISWQSVLLTVAILSLGAGAQWIRTPVASAAPPSLAMEVHGADRDLRIRWREVGATGYLESVTMVLRSGSDERVINLSARYTEEGELVVPARGRDVIVSLFVRRQGQPETIGTVTFVEPLPASPAGGSELERLRRRNKQLEAALLQGRE